MCKYDGEWSKGVKSGKGKLVSEEGFSYEGNFDNGVMNGYGKLANASFTYEGNF